MGSLRAYTTMVWLLILLVAVTSATVPLYMRDKPRSIRGFKNHALSTARGFGKRADSEFPVTPDTSDKERDSFPADWFAEELQNNGELARLIVHKFIDSNQDGELSADELLRPLFEKTTVYK